MMAFLIRWVKENMVLKLILPLSFLLFFHVFCKVAARKFKVTPMAAFVARLLFLLDSTALHCVLWLHSSSWEP